MTSGSRMNHIKLLFFATIRERMGLRSLEMDIPLNMTVEGLKEKLSSDYPNLKESLKSVLISINQEYAFDEALIPANAEIGMFPPVSGG
jgi:molybdopterin converting factor subunit 1